MRTLGRLLVLGWLLAALAALALDGHLAVFLAWAAPGSLVALVVVAVIRQQIAPSMLDRPALPERYRVADDLRRSVAEVVAAAEDEASAERA